MRCDSAGLRLPPAAAYVGRSSSSAPSRSIHPMKLVLKDRAFAVEQATLAAVIPDPYWSKKYNPKGYAGLAWSLTVEAEERELDASRWEAIPSHDELGPPARRRPERGA